MKCWVSISILIAFFASCKKDPPIEEPDFLNGEKSYLIGEWIWESSIHNYGLCENMSFIDTIQSESVSDTYKMLFSPNGIIAFIKNENVIYQYELYFTHSEIEETNEYYFISKLDNLTDSLFSGRGSKDSMRFTNYPFKDSDDGCEFFANYFKKSE